MSTQEDVIKIAKLAKIDIEPDNIKEVAANFAEILEHFARLNQVDTSGIDPAYHATLELGDAMADDTPEPPVISLREVMDNAPHSRDNQFRVPKVIE